MKGESGYKTKQRSEIIAYFETIGGQHVTAKDVHHALAESGSRIGAATVYRQLDKLVEEGVVRRYSLGQNGAACYEYAGESGSCVHPHCFHCLCIQCGKLYHMECKHLSGIADHLSADHGFTIDPQRTVFYGVCGDCAGEAGDMSQES